MRAVIVCLTQLSYLLFVSKSCVIQPPSSLTRYGTNFHALDDPNYVLFEVFNIRNSQFNSYCKMININDGTDGGVIPCNNSNIRSWSTGDIDPTSTQLLSGTD
eukprot:736567_1